MIERKQDGWYKDGRPLRFANEPVLWPTGHPVLTLAATLSRGNLRLAWVVLATATRVSELKSLGLDDDTRSATLYPHPAAVERRSSRWFAVEFVEGEQAVLQVARQGLWGPDDADVETTVTIVSGHVPEVTDEQIDSLRVPPIEVTEADIGRAVPIDANCSPAISIAYPDGHVNWMPISRFSCYRTKVTATPEAEAAIIALFEATMQRARDALLPYRDSGWWELTSSQRAEITRAYPDIPESFFCAAANQS